MADMIQVSLTATAARFTTSVSRFLHTTKQETNDAVRVEALNALGATRAGTPIDTGRLKAAWRGPWHVRELSWGYGNPTPYGPTVEYGLYQRLGPRTMKSGGLTLPDGLSIAPGIFSKQAPVGMMRKALAQVKPGLYRRITASHQRAWGR